MMTIHVSVMHVMVIHVLCNYNYIGIVIKSTRKLHVCNVRKYE